MIRFSKYIWLYFVISALVLVPGVYSLVRFGLRPAIDFTGGTLLEMKFKKQVSPKQIETAVASLHLEGATIQQSTGNSYIIRLKPETNQTVIKLREAIAERTKDTPEVSRNETVGPVLGKELLGKTITAAMFAVIVILAYVAYAFRNIKFGFSAVFALLHDLLVVLGVFSLLGHFYNVEVDTLFVTAFLTTMSFSVHDTIVVFDRIREMLKKGQRLPFEQLCDLSLTETVGRSLANSFTIIFMLLALVLMGGGTIHWFVVALLVGTVAGTYSSPFIATPVLILWNRWEKRKTRK